MLIASGLLNSVGTQMREIINLWVVFELTGSAVQLGILGAIRVIPLILLGFVGGVLADMFNRRKILMFGQGASLVLTGALAVLAVAGELQVWHIYLATLVNTSATVLDQPARMALISGVVPRSHMTNAVTMTSSVHQASVLIGPAIGGVIISLSDSATAYAVNAALFLPAIFMLQLIGNVKTEQTRSRPRLTGPELLAGLKFVVTTPIIVALMVLDFGVIAFTGYRILAPIFAEDILGIGSAGFGLLTSAPAVGFLIGSAVLLSLGDPRRKGLLVGGSVAAYAAAIFVFAISEWVALSLLALVFVGAFDGIGAIIRKTTLQLVVPEEIRGRATAVLGGITRTTTSVGFLTTGAIAAWIGAPEALMIGAGVSIAVLVFVFAVWGAVLRARF